MQSTVQQAIPQEFAAFANLEDAHYMTSELCHLANIYPNLLRHRLSVAGITPIGYGLGPNGKLEALWHGLKLRALGLESRHDVE